MMKILLAIDGSPCSDAAVDEVVRRKWDADSEIRIISVVGTPIAFATELTAAPAAYYEEFEKIERAKAREIIECAVAKLQEVKASRDLHITTDVPRGSPKRAIVEEAERFGADLIVVGSHGYRSWERMLLGSVSQAVALHAECSVLIVRKKKS